MKSAGTSPKKTAHGTYERDFYAWLISQVTALKERRFRDLDLENLIEEVEDLGKSLSRELRNSLRIVLIHLLKWRYQPEKRSTSWTVTLLEQRDEIEQLLVQSPSLRRQLPELLQKTYTAAAKRAGLEMRRGNVQHIFPQQCPWTIEQLLDEDYLPNGTRGRG